MFNWEAHLIYCLGKILTCVVEAFTSDLFDSRNYDSSCSLPVLPKLWCITSKLDIFTLVNAIEVLQIDLERSWGIFSRKNTRVLKSKPWHHIFLALFLIFSNHILSMYIRPTFSKIRKVPLEHSSKPQKICNRWLFISTLIPEKLNLEDFFLDFLQVLSEIWSPGVQWRPVRTFMYLSLIGSHLDALSMHGDALRIGLGVKCI